MFFSFSSLSAVVIGGMFAGGVHTISRQVPIVIDTIAFDTTQVVITSAILTQLTTFLEITADQWTNPDFQALLYANNVTYQLTLGEDPDVRVGGLHTTFPDFTVIATKIPAVAQALVTTKLTGPQLLQLFRSINCAYATDFFDQLYHKGKETYTETRTAVGKNVAFIRTRKEELQRFLKMAWPYVSYATHKSGRFNP